MVTITTITIITPVMLVTMVTITTYCYGRRERGLLKVKGVLLSQYRMREATAQHCATDCTKTRFAGFAVRIRRHGPMGRMPRQRWRARNAEELGMCEPGCVPGSQVCTPTSEKRPGAETQ